MRADGTPASNPALASPAPKFCLALQVSPCFCASFYRFERLLAKDHSPRSVRIGLAWPAADALRIVSTDINTDIATRVKVIG